MHEIRSNEVADVVQTVAQVQPIAEGGKRCGSGDRQTLGEPWKVIAHRELQPTAAFHDRENRCNLRSRLWAADVDPVLPTQSQPGTIPIRRHKGVCAS